MHSTHTQHTTPPPSRQSVGRSQHGLSVALHADDYGFGESLPTAFVQRRTLVLWPETQLCLVQSLHQRTPRRPGHQGSQASCVSSDLSWTPHIESVCTKARNLLGLLYRRFYNSAGSDTLFELYTTQIRPHLEYAAPVWDPCTARSIKKLENTQKLALKICSKQWDNLGFQDLLDLAKCPTLRNRRLYFKLCTLYKIVLTFLLIYCHLGQTSQHLYHFFINPLHAPILSSHLLFFLLYHYGTIYPTRL